MKKLLILLIIPLLFSCSQKKEKLQQHPKTEDLEIEKSPERPHDLDSIKNPPPFEKGLEDPATFGDPIESSVKKTCHCNCSCGTVSIYPCDDNCNCCIRACKQKCKD